MDRSANVSERGGSIDTTAIPDVIDMDLSSTTLFLKRKPLIRRADQTVLADTTAMRYGPRSMRLDPANLDVQPCRGWLVKLPRNDGEGFP